MEDSGSGDGGTIGAWTPRGGPAVHVAGWRPRFGRWPGDGRGHQVRIGQWCGVVVIGRVDGAPAPALLARHATVAPPVPAPPEREEGGRPDGEHDPDARHRGGADRV